jgi:hypothetical protein
MESWERKVEGYCKKYNVPLFYLAETLYEPKVVPMIRGKAFEFSVMVALQKILPTDSWVVDKPMMNAQTGFHDIDVRIRHLASNKIIKIECKLAKKGGFRSFPDGHVEIRVKCMRSRTLGAAKVKELAPKFGVPEHVLAIHNDQYLPVDYDLVITSIGNAFYSTDKQTGLFEWLPSRNGLDFLMALGMSSQDNPQDFAFNTMFIARTSDLAINNNGVVCTRGKCQNKTSCGFIPNYPIIQFDSNTYRPVNGWYSIKDCETLFNDFILDTLN